MTNWSMGENMNALLCKAVLTAQSLECEKQKLNQNKRYSRGSWIQIYFFWLTSMNSWKLIEIQKTEKINRCKFERTQIIYLKKRKEKSVRTLETTNKIMYFEVKNEEKIVTTTCQLEVLPWPIDVVDWLHGHDVHLPQSNKQIFVSWFASTVSFHFFHLSFFLRLSLCLLKDRFRSSPICRLCE